MVFPELDGKPGETDLSHDALFTIMAAICYIFILKV